MTVRCHYKTHKHKGANRCLMLMPTKCHCLVVVSATFWPCCGWYCDFCHGHFGDKVP